MNFSAPFTASDAVSNYNKSNSAALDWIYGKVIEKIMDASHTSISIPVNIGNFIKAYDEPCDRSYIITAVINSLAEVGFRAEQVQSMYNEDVITVHWA